MLDAIRRKARLRKLLAVVGTVLIIAVIVIWNILDQRSHDKWFYDIEDGLQQSYDFVRYADLRIVGSNLYINIDCKGVPTPEQTDPVAKMLQGKLDARTDGKPIYEPSFVSRGESEGVKSLYICFYSESDRYQKQRHPTVTYKEIYDVEHIAIVDGLPSARRQWYRTYKDETVEFDYNEE